MIAEERNIRSWATVLSWYVEKGFGKLPKGLSLKVHPARMTLMGPVLLTKDIASSILMLVKRQILTVRKLVVNLIRLFF
jgi:hypothetical protein